jgi:hypothetical protein
MNTKTSCQYGIDVTRFGFIIDSEKTRSSENDNLGFSLQPALKIAGLKGDLFTVRDLGKNFIAPGCREIGLLIAF